ncbi:Kazal domain [Phytophthora cactorum]|nr:Kazal domain [Phytophthora cactorum]
MPKLLLAATAVAVAALACSLSAVEALDRDKLLDVLGTVHGNRDIVVQYDDLEEDREERKCYGHFTRDIDPVCGSNGKKYTNLSMFNYRKCMMKIQESTEIQLVDMDFCKDAEMEDMEHIGEDDATNRIKMKTRIVMTVAVTLVAVCSTGVDATPAEKMLRVVSEVHAHPDVFVNGEEKRAKRHGHCHDTGAENEDPVCASNGKQYLNDEVFEFHKCLIQAEYGEIIEIVDMDICKNAKKEDDEHRTFPTSTTLHDTITKIKAHALCVPVQVQRSLHFRNLLLSATSVVVHSSSMKTILALVALLLAYAPVDALDREKRLRVVSSVHANERVLVSDQEEREKRHGHCVDDGTRNQDPVCASNGKKYLNMNRYEYNKCLIQAEEGEDITIVDLEFCREAMLEDIESEGLV